MIDNDVSAAHRRKRQEAARRSVEVRRRNAEKKAAALVEDIGFLMDPFWGGETDPDVIALRVGYAKKSSLARFLHRYGYGDLARKFDYNYNPETKRQWRELNHEKDLQQKRDSRRRVRQRSAAA